MAMNELEAQVWRWAQDNFRKEGRPTYAAILYHFDLNLTADPDVVAYTIPGEMRIVVNEKVGEERISVLLRHEIMHIYLDHELKLKRHLAKKMGIDLDDLSLSDVEKAANDEKIKKELYKDGTFNIAADYDISNKMYTDSDKNLVRHLVVNGQNCRGLVTEDDHADWVKLSLEDMYDKLAEQREKTKKEIEKQLEDLAEMMQDPEFKKGWDACVDAFNAGKPWRR